MLQQLLVLFMATKALTCVYVCNFLNAKVESQMFHTTGLRLERGLHTNADGSVICMAKERRYKSSCSFS